MVRHRPRRARLAGGDAKESWTREEVETRRGRKDKKNRGGGGREHLEIPRLIGLVLHDDVTLGVLVIPQADQHEVALVDPDLLAHLAADDPEALLAVEAEAGDPAVAEHLRHLRVLLAVLLERELALLAIAIALVPLGLVASGLVLRHARWAC
jgi:hypothetical protein